jgi:2'-5' RNA ligase
MPGFTEEELLNTRLCLIPVKDSKELATLRENIQESDYFSSDQNIEKDPHITVCLKINSENFNEIKVQEWIRNFKKFQVTMYLEVMKSANVKGEMRDILCLGIHQTNKELLDLHQSAIKHFNTHNPFDEYKPHLTIAFLKENAGAKYLAKNALVAYTIDVTSLLFRVYKDRTFANQKVFELQS